MTEIRRIYFEDLYEKLNVKDDRTVKNWCEKYSLIVCKDGKGLFVSESQFIQAYNMPFIIKFKEKFGQNWEEKYRAFESGEVYFNDDVVPTNNRYKSKLNSGLMDEFK